MSEVVTLEYYRPPPRFDSVAWTTASLEESADGLTGWTEIDTFTLTPADSDPSKPMYRSFTTSNGTALDYWYRIIFGDASGGLSQPTVALQNTGGTQLGPTYATIDELAAKLKVNAATYAGALQRVLLSAKLEIDREIGFSLSETNTGEEIALASSVNLARAQDLWLVEGLPVGVIGLGGETPLLTPRDSWVRHANTLAALKTSWGLA